MISKSNNLERLTVLYPHHTALLGGAEKCLCNMLKYLNKDRFEAIVILPERNYLSREMVKLGIDWKILKISWLRRKPGFMQALLLFSRLIFTSFKLRRFILREKIDIIHTNSISSQIQIGFVMGIKKIPKIWQARDILELNRLNRFLIKFAGSRASYIIAISEAVKANLISAGISPLKIVIVYDGVDVEEATSNISSEGWKRLRGITSDHSLVGIIGSISYLKGQDIFIEAASMVLRSYSNILFLVIGDYLPENYPFYEKLHSRVKLLNIEDKILFLKATDRIPEVIIALDILVNASRWREAFGMTIVEAMSLRKPVVASNTGGIPEIIDENCGLLFIPGSAEDLAEKIITILKDKKLAIQMGVYGRKKVETYFNIKNTIRRIEELYKSISRRDLR